MLIVNHIARDPEGAKAKLLRRNFKEVSLVDDAIQLDTERKQLQVGKDELLARRNELSRSIGELFKAGKTEEANTMKAEIAKLKDELSGVEAKHDEAVAKLSEVLVQIPNLPHDSVPQGNSDADNELVRTSGHSLEFPDSRKPHWELAEQYGIIDFETAAKVSGAGFVMFRGQGAVLQRALINFFLDQAIEAGFHEIVPPLLVNEDSAYGTGQLPDKEGQMYHVTADNLYLIPTSEVPLTNVYRDVIVDESELPVKLVGYSQCFRREAGSYGSDVRGLNRVHQFDKVEIVQIVKPEDSYVTLDTMVDHVAGLLDKLELPYRIMRLCGGDLGFTSALTYDFEVYSAAQDKWLEVSSVSNFESFQANRLKLRYKNKDKKKALCHTLNGSALALARIIACLLENNQHPDGIHIPAALQPYTRFVKIN